MLYYYLATECRCLQRNSCVKSVPDTCSAALPSQRAGQQDQLPHLADLLFINNIWTSL